MHVTDRKGLHPKELNALLRAFQISHGQIGDLSLNFFLLCTPSRGTIRGFVLSVSLGRCEVLGLVGGRVETGWKERLLLSVYKCNWFARVTRGGRSWQSPGERDRGPRTQLGGQRPGRNHVYLFWDKANLEYNGILISIIFTHSTQLH